MLYKTFRFLCLCPFLLMAEEGRTLSTQASAKTQLDATVAEIRFGVEVENTSADKAQSSLAERVNALYAILKQAEHSFLNTTQFTVSPEYTNTSPPEIKSYRGRGEIVVAVKKELAGQIIADAVQHGSNRVNGIDLKADEAHIEAGRQQAIQEACKRAVANSQAALNVLQLKLDAVESVEVNVTPTPPQPWRGGVMAFAAKNDTLQLEGTQEVEAQVNLKVRFLPKSKE